MKRHLARLSRLANRHELLLLLLLLVILLRFPTLFEPLWYGDEAIYLAIGQAMRHGLVLYQTVTDYPNKPPLIYLLASLVQTVSVFRLVLLFWTLATTAVFFTLVNRLTHSRLVTLISTLIFIYLTSTPVLEGTIANAEIFFILPSLLGMYFLTHLFTRTPENKYLLLAGLAFGFSFLFKIHAFFDLLAAMAITTLVVTRWFHPKQLVSTTIRLFLLGFGFALPILSTFTLLFFWNISPFSLYSNAADSSGYIAANPFALTLTDLLSLSTLTARALALFAGLILLLLLRRFFTKTSLIPLFWLPFALFAALLSGRNYPHYLIQIAPPLVLGAGMLLASNKIATKTALFFSGIITLLLINHFNFFTYPVIPYYQNFLAYQSGRIDQSEYYRRFDSRMPRNYELASLIRTTTLPDEPIYVWGTDADVYVLSRRHQVDKLVVSFHVPDLDYFNQTAASLRASLPPVIVVMETEPRPFPALKTLLASNYYLAATVPASAPPGTRALLYRRLSLTTPTTGSL